MTRITWLLVSCLLVACGKPTAEAPSKTKDLATNYVAGDGVFLFYVEQGTLYRAHCDDDRLIYNRSTCTDVVGSADFALFSERLQAQFAEPLVGLEQQVTDLQARIQEIDLELLMLLSQVPDPIDPTLKDQIDAKQDQVATAGADVIQLEDQIKRIQDALGRQENPDLRAQLITLQGQMADKKTGAEALRTELAGVRQKYIQANAGSFEPRRFRTIQDERALRVHQLDSRHGSLDEVMRFLVAVSQVMTDTLQQGFTNVYLSGTTGDPGAIRIVINAFDGIFARLDPANRTFRASFENGGRAIVLSLPNPSYIEHFYCAVQSGCGSSSQAWIDVEGPMLHTTVNAFQFDVTPDTVSDRHLAAMQTANVGGGWRIITPYCTDRIAAATCYATIKP